VGLVIEADVSELYASKDVTSGLVLATLDAQKLTYEKQYYKDLAPSEIARISATRPEIGQQVAMTISRILNVPVAMLLTGTTRAGG
jgi:hypothetical protein